MTKPQGIIELLKPEVPALLDLIATTVGPVLEVGTGDGVFLAMAAAKFPDRVFHCVDWFNAAEGSGTRAGNRTQWHANLDTFPHVTLFEGKSNDVLPTLATEYGMVFIDADHSSAAALADAHNAWRLLLPDGLLAFHDYGSHDSVRAAVKEFASNVSRPIVPLAGTIVVVPSGDDWEPQRQCPLHNGVHR